MGVTHKWWCTGLQIRTRVSSILTTLAKKEQLPLDGVVDILGFEPRFVGSIPTGAAKHNGASVGCISARELIDI